MHFDVIGTLYDTDMSDPENPISTPLAGFHLNTTAPIEGADEYLVEPTIPRRVFAGVKTYFYCFKSESQMSEVVPELAPVEVEDEVA